MTESQRCASSTLWTTPSALQSIAFSTLCDAVAGLCPSPCCQLRRQAASVSGLLLLCCLAKWAKMHGVLFCRYAPLSIDFPSAVAALRQLAMKVQPYVAHVWQSSPCVRR